MHQFMICKGIQAKQSLPMTFTPKKFWVFLIIRKGTPPGFSWFWVNTCDWLGYLIQMINWFFQPKLGNDFWPPRHARWVCRLLVGAPSLARDSISTVADFWHETFLNASISKGYGRKSAKCVCVCLGEGLTLTYVRAPAVLSPLN